MPTGVKSTDLIRSLIRRGYTRGSPDRRAGVMRNRALDGGSTLRFGRRIRGDAQPQKTVHSVLPGLITQLITQESQTINPTTVHMSLLAQDMTQFVPNIRRTVAPALMDATITQLPFQIPTVVTISPDLITQLITQLVPTINPLTIRPQVMAMDITQRNLDVYVNYIVSPALITQLITQESMGVGVVPGLQDITMTQEAVTFTFTLGVSTNLQDITITQLNPAIQQGQAHTVALELADMEMTQFTLRVVVPTRSVIDLKARYDPVIDLKARYDHIIRLKAQNPRQE